MSFQKLGLMPALTRALQEQGYQNPTEIQAEAIPLALSGADIMGGAQTGTGKTAAFTLPLLQRLFPKEAQGGSRQRRVRALVLTPTRELADQVHQSVRGYGKYLPMATTSIYGGVGMGGQMQALRRGVDIVVATPGRLIDHMDRRTIDLSSIEILVLDEADRMLDMGFLPALKKILTSIPKNRQTLLFSATFSDEIKRLAAQFMRNPKELQIAQRNSVAATVIHVAHPVDQDRKKDLLIHLLAQDSRRQTLVFSRTKHGCDRLARQLEAAGFSSDAIHGDKTQGARSKALREFKTGKTTILVATDIAARGLDISSLPMVLNYDMPMVAEDYIHRIGRTGRAGAEGHAVSLVCHAEQHLLHAIQRLLKRDIKLDPVVGFEPSRAIHSAPAARKNAPGGRPANNRGHIRRQHAGQPGRAAPHAIQNKRPSRQKPGQQNPHNRSKVSR